MRAGAGCSAKFGSGTHRRLDPPATLAVAAERTTQRPARDSDPPAEGEVCRPDEGGVYSAIKRGPNPIVMVAPVHARRVAPVAELIAVRAEVDVCPPVEGGD